MKNVLLTVAATLAVMLVQAQDLTYRVIYDAAPEPRVNVNLDLFQLDMGVSNLDGMSFNYGAFGFVQPNEKLGVSFNFKKSMLMLSKIAFADYPGNVDLSAGPYLFLNQSTKVRNTKISLDREYVGSEFSTNVSGDRVETRTEIETYMMIPATRFLATGVRGGIYLKRGPFLYEPSDSDFTLDNREMALTSFGVYGGLLRRSVKNVFVETDQYGVQFNSIGDDIALDLLIVPVNNFTDLAEMEPVADANALVKGDLGNFPLGFRIGWYRYQIEKKARTGKKFGLAMSAETGFKPYQGFFINTSIAITLIKKTNN